MGYRRSPDRVAAERDWQRFVERNSRLIAAAGLPPLATARVSAWDDFLIHGYLAGDTDDFAVNHLTPTQYEALVELATNYFLAGYEFYSPLALRSEDQLALRSRFGGGR